MASGTALRIASMAASATGVRSVISSTRNPPAARARASGTAVFEFGDGEHRYDRRQGDDFTDIHGILGVGSNCGRSRAELRSHQRHGAGFRIAGGAPQARKQFAAAAILVVRMIEIGHVPLPPDLLGNLRLEDAGVTIQTDHVAVAHLAQGRRRSSASGVT